MYRPKHESIIPRRPTTAELAVANPGALKRRLEEFDIPATTKAQSNRVSAVGRTDVTKIEASSTVDPDVPALVSVGKKQQSAGNKLKAVLKAPSAKQPSSDRESRNKVFKILQSDILLLKSFVTGFENRLLRIESQAKTSTEVPRKVEKHFDKAVYDRLSLLEKSVLKMSEVDRKEAEKKKQLANLPKNYVPKVASGYMLFLASVRTKIKNDNPNEGNPFIMKEGGRQWNCLSAERKTIFNSESARLNAMRDAIILSITTLTPMTISSAPTSYF